MSNAPPWCATYLRAQVRSVGGTRDTVVTAVRPSGVVLVLDPPLPNRAPLYLGIVPDPGREPIWAHGTVSELVPTGDSSVFGPPPLLTEAHLDDTPSELVRLFDREMAAAWRSRRVVIVDDDLLQLRVLQLIMPRLGYDPICVSTAIGATHVIAEAAPRLILLDINMPDLDGPTLCRMLRANPATRDTPVVFLSALPRERIIEAVASSGARGFIEKGADVNAIIAELHRQLRP